MSNRKEIVIYNHGSPHSIDMMSPFKDLHLVAFRPFEICERFCYDTVIPEEMRVFHIVWHHYPWCLCYRLTDGPHLLISYLC